MLAVLTYRNVNTSMFKILVILNTVILKLFPHLVLHSIEPKHAFSPASTAQSILIVSSVFLGY